MSCQKAFLTLAVATIACSDPLTPRSISGVYVLETVNGQPLPVIIGPIPEETISVLQGRVTLTSDAKVLIVERRREVRQNVPSERTYESMYNFVLDGNRIGFIIHCPPNANCISMEGIVSGERLRIALGGFSSPNARIYEYVYRPVGF